LTGRPISPFTSPSRLRDPGLVWRYRATDGVQVAGRLGGGLPLLIGVHRALRACECAALGELGVDGGDEIAAVIVADHRGGRCRIEPEPAILDGIDHPLNRAVL
jgi:hypothetical protein